MYQQTGEFLPGLPANQNNIGAVVNYLREGNSIEYNDKESEITWGFEIEKDGFCGRRKRDDPEPEINSGTVRVWLLQRVPDDPNLPPGDIGGVANSYSGPWYACVFAPLCAVLLGCLLGWRDGMDGSSG